MVYGNTAASALGSLLRKAQEDRQQGPHLIPQSAEAESPIRQQIQGPISAPESVGSEKVVAMKGEMQPIQEGGTMPVGIDGTTGPAVVPPIVPPMSSDMSPVGPMGASPMGIPSAMSTGIGSPLLPSSMKPGAGKSVAQGNVLGTSTSKPSLGQPLLPTGSRGTGKLMAPAGEWTEIDVAKPKESFPSNQAWQAAQTPKQNILGGIGKVGTGITTAIGNVLNKIGIPDIQLKPGGAFQQLQNKMAPTVKDLLFGKNRTVA